MLHSVSPGEGEAVGEAPLHSLVSVRRAVMPPYGSLLWLVAEADVPVEGVMRPGEAVPAAVSEGSVSPPGIP